MAFAAGAQRRAAEDKKKIDDLILNTLAPGRLSYILKSRDPHSRTLQFLREANNDELHDIIMVHRFYFEIKCKEVIDNAG